MHLLYGEVEGGGWSMTVAIHTTSFLFSKPQIMINKSMAVDLLNIPPSTAFGADLTGHQHHYRQLQPPDNNSWFKSTQGTEHPGNSTITEKEQLTRWQPRCCSMCYTRKAPCAWHFHLHINVMTREVQKAWQGKKEGKERRIPLFCWLGTCSLSNTTATAHGQALSHHKLSWIQPKPKDAWGRSMCLPGAPGSSLSERKATRSYFQKQEELLLLVLL